MAVEEMFLIAGFINTALRNGDLAGIKKEVHDLAAKFPMP